MRPHFLDLSPAEVRAHLERLRLLELGSRLPEQAFRGIHQLGAPGFDAIPGLARHKRKALLSAFEHRPLDIAAEHASWDGSVRYAFRLEDDTVIETMLLPHHGLWTACVSSQAGCALACRFCATGKLGLLRNLHTFEIVGQVLAIAARSGRRISDLVFMGMGEPLQNERAVFKACEILAAAFGTQISPRRMVISTSGVVPAIRRFTAARHRMKLVFSLASAVPEKRRRLMPIQDVHGFDDLIAAIREHSASLGGKHVTLEYLAIRNLTLGDDDIEALRENLKGLRFILNVIPLNPVDPVLEAPTLEEVHAWTERLRPLGFPVKIRRSSGRDQQGGCGQLGTAMLAQGKTGVRIR